MLARDCPARGARGPARKPAGAVSAAGCGALYWWPLGLPGVGTGGIAWAAARAAVTLTGPRRCGGMTSQLASRLATSAPRSKRTTQAASCAIRMAADCVASTQSGRLQAGDVTRRQPEHAADDPVHPAADRPRRDQRPNDDRGGGHRQLADTPATWRPMAGTTMALLSHGGAHLPAARCPPERRRAGWRPGPNLSLTGSLHEAVPGG